MKHKFYIKTNALLRFAVYILLPLVGGGWVGVSCSDWGDHYDEAVVTTEAVEVYQGDIVSYIRQAKDLSQFSDLFEATGSYTTTYTNQQYTFVVCDDAAFNGSGLVNPQNMSTLQIVANNCIADIAVTPSELVDGFGINNRAGKTLWVYGTGNSLRIDNFSIKRIVKTSNGYVYVLDGLLPVRQSVYEYLNGLGDDYSMFKDLVGKYEQRVFDREHSAAIGINQAGEVVYDTVWVTRNSLMDRYTDGGVATWNMRDEQYVTTMFVPSNQLVQKAIQSALDSIPSWLNRQPTDADRAKFEEWIVRACFSDRRLETSEVSVSAPDFQAVGDYRMYIDETADETTYKAAEETWWRPRVQKADTGNRVSLSNGYAYLLTDFKIPNHVVIYRLKARFYQIWDASNIRNDAETMHEYFYWINLDESSIRTSVSTLATYDALAQYGWPANDYNLLTAFPTEEAERDSLPCGVEYTGLIYDPATDEALECHIPAGEYYLRMGFDRTTVYTFDIYFNSRLVISGLKSGLLNADRIANDIPTYGIMAPGYPEGFDPEEWREYEANVAAYDTDGYTVGLVSQRQNGPFTIRVISNDLTPRFKRTEPGDGSNSTQWMMYHWCLRPTHNNY